MEILLDEMAKKKIKETETEDRKARIYMGGTSCSGAILGLSFNQKEEGDQEVEVDGLTIYVQGDLEEMAPKVHIKYRDSGLKMGFSVSEGEEKNYC